MLLSLAGIILVSQDEHIQTEGQTDTRRSIPRETDPGGCTQETAEKEAGRLGGDGGGRDSGV